MASWGWLRRVKSVPVLLLESLLNGSRLSLSLHARLLGSGGLLMSSSDPALQRSQIPVGAAKLLRLRAS